MKCLHFGVFYVGCSSSEYFGLSVKRNQRKNIKHKKRQNSNVTEIHGTAVDSYLNLVVFYFLCTFDFSVVKQKVVCLTRSIDAFQYSSASFFAHLAQCAKRILSDCSNCSLIFGCFCSEVCTNTSSKIVFVWYSIFRGNIWKEERGGAAHPGRMGELGRENSVETSQIWNVNQMNFLSMTLT